MEHKWGTCVDNPTIAKCECGFMGATAEEMVSHVKDAEIAVLRDRLNIFVDGMSPCEQAFWIECHRKLLTKDAEIAALRYELLAEKTARADADNAIARLKEELRLAGLTIEAWIENYDTIFKRAAALKKRVRELEVEK